MSEARPARDVSCLALTFFYDYLETHGRSREEIQKDLPYSPEYLDHRTNWIDYATFLEIERRMAALFDDPELFFNIGRTFGATEGFGFLRVIFRSVVSPFQLYSRLPRLVARFLFPFVSISFERLSSNHFRGTYVFAPGYPPSAAFTDTVRGILTGVPAMLGAQPAKVRVRQLTPDTVQFDVELSRQHGPIEAVRALRRRMMKTGRLWWRNLGDVVNELEDTNRLLQEKVDALTEAKAEVDRNIRDLSLLHALVHSGTTERELGPMLEKMMALLSSELGGVPAAVILPEGEPPQAVLAANEGLSLDVQEALAREPAIDRSLAGERGSAEVRDLTVELLPMITRERVVGTLLLGKTPERLQPRFSETIAREVAVLIDNALAFRTIADLRDNLEVRVHERTAELEEAREQLEDTVEQLRSADRSRNAFFTNVSHELRTPLTLILAPLDTLESELARAGVEVGEDLRSIRHNAQLLLRQINEILDFARLDADRMPIHATDVDLGTLLEEVVVALAPLARKKGVALGVEPLPEPLAIHVDPRLGRRVFFNLVANAIKYIDPGDSVSVAARSLEDAVEVEVVDTGPGIPKEFRDRIFERFERVPDARGRFIEGSGLGLAMVRDIVERHRGTVELRDTKGRGATFAVVLPRGEPAPASERAAMPSPEEWVETLELEAPRGPERLRTAISSASGGRVLLVEDNPEMRSFLSRLLGAHHRLTWAEDGKEGLERTQRELPDLVVSDVMMPRMDGYALCRAIKENPLTRGIPVVLVSARDGIEAALEGFHAGADDYVVKPFSAPELLARINAQLRLRTMTNALLRMEKQSTLGTLSAGIAHEVLNPINAVVNALPALRKCVKRLAAGSGTAADCDLLVDTVERGGQRVIQIVRTLLSLSRQPEAKPELREVKLSQSIEPVLELIRHRIGERIRLHRDFRWDGALVCAPELVGQIVLNLVGNAIDALGPDGGNIWLTTERDGGEVRVRVRDDGPGIPGELRERVFDAFFTTKPPGAGTGLGLALSREFATLQGGELSLENAVEGGAEFVLTLPDRTNAELADRRPGAGEPASFGEVPS